MGRPLRIEYNGAFYHVVTHGNGRLWLFKENSDYNYFLDILGIGVKKFKVKVHAFVLMRNHIHLLIETPLGNLSTFMKFVLSRYGSKYNKKSKRHGSVFKSRYGSFLVQKDKYYLTLIRYIYQNPVKAKIVDRAEDYRWSSLYYLLHPQEMKKISWFKPDVAYSIIGSTKELKKVVNNREIKYPDVLYRIFVGERDWAEDILDMNKIKLGDKNINGTGEIKKEFKRDEAIQKVLNLLGTDRKHIISNKKDIRYYAFIYILKETSPFTNKEIAKITKSSDYAIAKLYSRMKKSPENYQESIRIGEKIIRKMSNVKT